MNIKDIPDTLEEFIKWSSVSPDLCVHRRHLIFVYSPKAYEEEHMVPATSNRDVAQFTVDELLHSVPTTFGIKALAQRIVVCLLEEPVRIAMM
jgi:hypothetical protein